MTRSRLAGWLAARCACRPAGSRRGEGMHASYLELSYGQVALAAALIVVNGAVSLVLRLV